jgi:hypothetical protein
MTSGSVIGRSCGVADAGAGTGVLPAWVMHATFPTSRQMNRTQTHVCTQFQVRYPESPPEAAGATTFPAASSHS